VTFATSENKNNGFFILILFENEKGEVVYKFGRKM